MKIADALAFAKNELKRNSIENFSLDALILLQKTTSFTKEKIIFNPDFLLSQEQIITYFNLINRRLKKEPISHIVGKREFFGLDFIVTKDVLDPRPDSEILVETILRYFSNQKISFLEIGVGSGCLIISILKNLENARATALDISKDALLICDKNSKNHQLENRLELIESNLFEKISPEKKFDVIISNPPYIKTQEIENLQDEVKIFEPRKALDGGIDGLDFYRKIAKNSKNFLNKNGLIFLEIGFDQKKDVIEIFNAENFKLIEAKKDFGDNDRVLVFCKIL